MPLVLVGFRALNWVMVLLIVFQQFACCQEGEKPWRGGIAAMVLLVHWLSFYFWDNAELNPILKGNGGTLE
jgi:hypothetical protein